MLFDVTYIINEYNKNSLMLLQYRNIENNKVEIEREVMVIVLTEYVICIDEYVNGIDDIYVDNN